MVQRYTSRQIHTIIAGGTKWGKRGVRNSSACDWYRCRFVPMPKCLAFVYEYCCQQVQEILRFLPTNKFRRLCECYFPFRVKLVPFWGFWKQFKNKICMQSRCHCLNFILITYPNIIEAAQLLITPKYHWCSSTFNYIPKYHWGSSRWL
jgi:hypothetical protein